MIALSDDPAVAVSWSADGGWLACRVATGGGVRTQVWVVRPDGRDARLVAGGPGRHAELGPWTRSGHRVAVTIPGARGGQPTASPTSCDPANGELTPLAAGDLISVLDLSVDESYVIVKDGPRGRQFCVVVDRLADQDLPLLPYPALGSTERAMIRPAPDGDGLVAYLATDAGLPRRQLVAIPLGPAGWRGESGILCPREDAELEGLDGDDAGHLLLLVWNVAGGRSELELLDTRTGVSRTAPELSGVVTGALLSRDGSTAVMSVEGPLRPRELWSLDTATLTWTRVTEGPVLPEFGLVRPSLRVLPRPRRAAADRLAVPAAGRVRPWTGGAQPARRPGGAGAAHLLPAAPGPGRRRVHRLRAQHPRLVGLRPGVRALR